MTMKRVVNFLCLLLVWAAASSQEAFLRKDYVSDRGDTLRYRLLEPETLEPGAKYPLVLFLHGAGERGTDNEKQLKHGAQMWLRQTTIGLISDVQLRYNHRICLWMYLCLRCFAH